nr:retrotransposon protein, putative, Ty1-copia subclass [Tanacetum cinerariifolium]
MIQPSSSKIAEDEVECTDDVPGPSVPRKSTRTRKAKSFGISTIRLLLALAAIQDLVIHQMDVKTAFLNGDLDEEIYMKQPESTDQDQVSKTQEFLSSKFNMKDLGKAEVILGIRIKRGNNDPTVKFRPNKGTSVSQLEYSRAIGYHSSTSGCVFFLGGGAIYWALNKQTCITSSTMESEFVALAAAGNEAE